MLFNEDFEDGKAQCFLVIFKKQVVCKIQSGQQQRLF
jgi:hypothetical protein